MVRHATATITKTEKILQFILPTRRFTNENNKSKSIVDARCCRCSALLVNSVHIVKLAALIKLRPGNESEGIAQYISLGKFELMSRVCEPARVTLCTSCD